VAQDVGADFLGGQGRAGGCRGGGVDGEAAFDGVAGQVAAVASGEQGGF
jgi:hypothetical protein